MGSYECSAVRETGLVVPLSAGLEVVCDNFAYEFSLQPSPLLRRFQCLTLRCRVLGQRSVRDAVCVSGESSCVPFLSLSSAPLYSLPTCHAQSGSQEMCSGGEWGVLRPSRHAAWERTFAVLGNVNRCEAPCRPSTSRGSTTVVDWPLRLHGGSLSPVPLCTLLTAASAVSKTRDLRVCVCCEPCLCGSDLFWVIPPRVQERECVPERTPRLP